MRIIFALMAFLAFSLPGSQAFAAGHIYDADRGESFAQPTWRDMGQLLFQLEDLNVDEASTIDDYAKLYYCGLYKEKYKDDFEWDKVRRQLATRVRSKKDYYRTLYELDGTVDLDRYSFDAQAFPLTSASMMDRVGSMVLFDASDDTTKRYLYLCGDTHITLVFPAQYIIKFRVPLSFDRLKMSPAEAKVLLEKMDAAKNKQRRLWVRFRMRVTGFEHFNRAQLHVGTLFVKGEMVSLDLYYDKEMTKFMTSVYIPHL